LTHGSEKWTRTTENSAFFSALLLAGRRASGYNKARITGKTGIERRNSMKAIVTIVGKDQVGIIANVCSQLAACNINILEISQKIMDGFFTMMLITDLSGCEKPLDEVSDLLSVCAKGKTLSIRIQREEMFDAMYKL